VSRFDFLLPKSVSSLEQYEKRVAIIDDFLFEKSINIFYGPAGLGKTWFMFGLAQNLVKKGFDVVYIDSDNGIDTIKDRGYDKVIERLHPKLIYLNGDTMDDTKRDINAIFEEIEQGAEQGYEKAAFIYDSLTFFLNGSVYDEQKIDRFIVHCKRIRRAGGTVFVINHATKNGSAMKGGGTLVNAVDEVWRAERLEGEEGWMSFSLAPTKQRLRVKACAYSVNIKTLELKKQNLLLVSIDEEQQAFIDQVHEKLAEQGLSQNQLMESLGYNKADKSKLALLEKFTGHFWSVEKGQNRAKVYTLMGTKTQTTQETPSLFA